mgnify:CR=1 FL=1
MSDKAKEIMKTFSEIVPKLNEAQQEKLLSFGEGMVFMKNREDKKDTERQTA